MALSSADLQRLAGVVARRSGITFHEARLPFLGARARAVMAWAGVRDWDRWLAELEASAEEGGHLYAQFEEALHVHETQFFRYPGHHALLGDTVLPALGAASAGGRAERLRVLSAGCSTGQEPYSIAMTIHEKACREAAETAEVVAVDISRPALAAASRGVYGPVSVASVSSPLLERYFVREPRGFSVKPSLRSMVRFLLQDLRRDLHLGKFDAIFCCNILLYFMRAAKEHLVERFATVLRQGGYLFLGHAEGVTPPASVFRALYQPAGVVYQRM